MKKHAKKILTIVIALTMALQIGIPVFASDVSAQSADYTLVTHWDFEGENPYADKATRGTAEALTETGTVVTENGVAYIESDGKNYLGTGTVAENSDLYSFANKTIIMRAKMDKNPPTLYAGFIGKQNVFSCAVRDTLKGAIYSYTASGNFSNTDSSSSDFGTTSLETNANCQEAEYRVYAITFLYSEANNNVTIKLYKSSVEVPTSASDFVEYVSKPGAQYANEGEFIIGRHTGHTTNTNNRNLSTWVDDVKIFDGVLTAEQMVKESAVPTFQGSQTAIGGDVNTSDDNFAIRFVGSTGSKDVAELGFKWSAKDGNGNELKTERFSKVQHVYNKITGNTELGLKEYTCYGDFHSAYIYAYAVTDIPLSLLDNGGTVVFTVTPYSVAKEETDKIEGKTFDVTVSMNEGKIMISYD